MTGSKVLEVAIGLSFTYLLLSLVCSALNEIVAGLVGLRQSTLSDGIQQMLRNSAPLRNAVYAHPLIQGLEHGTSRRKPPSYLSREAFAAALHDILTNPGESLKRELGAGAQALEEVETAVSALLRGTRVGDELDQEWKTLGTWAEKEREAIGRWFDDAMDRVTGAYKRRTQVTVAAIALVTAAAMNVDSLAVARALWTDADLRGAMAENAKAYVATESRPAWVEPDPQAAVAQLTESTRRYADAIAKVESLNLPVGWTDEALARLGRREGWGAKLLGLLFTVVAISLGAPFWFDTLNRIANLRAAGGRPEAPSTDVARRGTR